MSDDLGDIREFMGEVRSDVKTLYVRLDRIENKLDDWMERGGAGAPKFLKTFLAAGLVVAGIVGACAGELVKVIVR